jgi:hypothetical protein
MVQPDYSSTAFLHTQPDETIAAGEVSPGDPVSRLMHGYPDADGADQLLVSSYEGNDDTRPIAGLARATGFSHRRQSRYSLRTSRR